MRLRNDFKSALVYEVEGELYVRILNERNEPMWFDLRKGLTSAVIDVALEAEFQTLSVSALT